MSRLPIFLFLLTYILFPLTSSAVVSPEELNIKIHKFILSTDPLCVDASTYVYLLNDEDENSSYVAQYQNVLLAPEFGSKSGVPFGNYPCVLIEFSDNITYVPAESEAPHCVGGTSYTLDVCDFSGDYRKLDGSTGTCNSTEQRVVMYLSTAAVSSTGEGSNGFLPPASLGDATQGFNLANPFVISGNDIAKFIVDGRNRIDGTGSECEMNVPLFDAKLNDDA